MGLFDDALEAARRVVDDRVAVLEGQAHNADIRAATAESNVAELTVQLAAAQSQRDQNRDLYLAAKAQLTAVQADFDTYKAKWPAEKPTTPAAFPLVFGGATTNNPADFAALNAAWGPIRMSREYDSGGGFKPVDQYAWYRFVKDQGFRYLSFSADAGNADYPKIAAGGFDDQIRAMLASLPVKLPGVKGLVCLGNEPNASKKGIAASDYRAALEHCIDVFGDEPAPGFRWAVAFTNFNVWGAGSTDGVAWLPRRDGKFAVETHFYGRADYPDPANALRTLVAEVRKHPDWIWGIGEISAEEDAGHTKKAAWFTAVGKFLRDNGASFFLPFDTGVNGSAPIATSENTRSAVKAIAESCARNDWT